MWTATTTCSQICSSMCETWYEMDCAGQSEHTNGKERVRRVSLTGERMTHRADKRVRRFTIQWYSKLQLPMSRSATYIHDTIIQHISTNQSTYNVLKSVHIVQVVRSVTRSGLALRAVHALLSRPCLIASEKEAYLSELPNEAIKKPIPSQVSLASPNNIFVPGM